MINLDEPIATHIDGAFVPEGNVCWIATANKNGEPDIGPKGSMMVFDDQSLAYWERTNRQTLQNILENPNVAVVYRNAEERLQWRFPRCGHGAFRRRRTRTGHGKDHSPRTGA